MRSKVTLAGAVDVLVVWGCEAAWLVRLLRRLHPRGFVTVRRLLGGPFRLYWNAHQVVCPRGQASRTWKPLRISGHDYIQVRFGEAACRACTDRARCTNSEVRPRSLALLPTRELHEIQQANRLDQRTRQWQDRYAIRAAIEATLSQSVRTCGLRRTRYRGLRKTHVQHIMTALACNVTRIADWIAGLTRKQRAPSHFHALCTAAS